MLNCLLECAAGPQLAIAKIANDAWVSLAAVPRAERAAHCCEPLFALLLPRLLASCQYPADFGRLGGPGDASLSWDDYEKDAGACDRDDFVRYRDHVRQQQRRWRQAPTRFTPLSPPLSAPGRRQRAAGGRRRGRRALRPRPCIPRDGLVAPRQG